MRFDVLLTTPVHKKNNPFLEGLLRSGLLKTIETKSIQLTSPGDECVVFLDNPASEKLVRIEIGLSTLVPEIVAIGFSRCFLFYPEENLVIDTTYDIKNIKARFIELIECFRVEGISLVMEDGIENWLCELKDSQSVVELCISKSSKLVKHKKVFDRNKSELLSELRYSNFELKTRFQG